MSSTLSPKQFREQVAQLTAQLAGRPLDAALDAWLNAEHGAGSATYQQLKASCEAGVAAGWLCAWPRQGSNGAARNCRRPG